MAQKCRALKWKNTSSLIFMHRLKLMRFTGVKELYPSFNCPFTDFDPGKLLCCFCFVLLNDLCFFVNILITLGDSKSLEFLHGNNHLLWPIPVFAFCSWVQTQSQKATVACLPRWLFSWTEFVVHCWPFTYPCGDHYRSDSYLETMFTWSHQCGKFSEITSHFNSNKTQSTLLY